jgi:hypothetical protein
MKPKFSGPAICRLWRKLQDLAIEAEDEITPLEMSSHDGGLQIVFGRPPHHVIHDLQIVCARLEDAYSLNTRGSLASIRKWAEALLALINERGITATHDEKEELKRIASAPKLHDYEFLERKEDEWDYEYTPRFDRGDFEQLRRALATLVMLPSKKRDCIYKALREANAAAKAEAVEEEAIRFELWRMEQEDSFDAPPDAIA